MSSCRFKVHMVVIGAYHVVQCEGLHRGRHIFPRFGHQAHHLETCQCNALRELVHCDIAGRCHQYLKRLITLLLRIFSSKDIFTFLKMLLILDRLEAHLEDWCSPRRCGVFRKGLLQCQAD